MRTDTKLSHIPHSPSSEYELSLLDAAAEDIWKEANLAFALKEQEECDLSPVLPDELATSQDPALHKCPGPACTHCEPTIDGLVCCLSGIAWPRFAIHDAIAAGHVHSHDENGVACSAQEEMRRKYISRTRNMQRASEMAFSGAASSTNAKDDDAFIAYGMKQEQSNRTRILELKSRRINASHFRRCRTSKRDITRVNSDALVSEAMRMFDRLMKSDDAKGVDQAGRIAKRQLRCSDPNCTPIPDGDDIRYYVELCQANSEKVNLDRLHEMLQKHDTTKLMNSRRQLIQEEYTQHTHWYRSVKEYASKLAVCLWKCAVLSPYMQKGQRTSDNFRPFVAGVFFSTRRGVKLADGTVLIPRCLAIASALPRSKGDPDQMRTHQIHLSAHKGVCTLHKSIRSVDNAEVGRFYSDAIELARVLYEIDRVKSR